MEDVAATALTVDLNGEFRFKADAKGRVSLPAKFRKVLPIELVVTLDPDSRYLMVFTSEDFNEWVKDLMKATLGEFDSSSRKHLGMRRALKARAYDVQVDSAGRIMLPAEQRTTAGIDKDVVIVGNEGYFEVWDAKRYASDSEEFDLSSLLNA